MEFRKAEALTPLSSSSDTPWGFLGRRQSQWGGEQKGRALQVDPATVPGRCACSDWASVFSPCSPHSTSEPWRTASSVCLSFSPQPSKSVFCFWLPPSVSGPGSSQEHYTSARQVLRLTEGWQWPDRLEAHGSRVGEERWGWEGRKGRWPLRSRDRPTQGPVGDTLKNPVSQM